MCDTEQLILEVQKRECLWKASNKRYMDRNAKGNAWQEVLAELYSGWESYSAVQRINLANDIQRKWKNLRDSFMKELKRQKNSGKAPDNRKKYMYFDSLIFLMPGLESRRTENNTPLEMTPDDFVIKLEEHDTQEETREESEESELSAMPPRKRRRSEKQKSESLEDNLLSAILPKSGSNDLMEINEDVAFFMSLVPSVQRLNDGQKLDFRIRVLNALKHVKHENNTVQYQFQPPSSFTILPPSQNLIVSHQIQMESSPSSASPISDY